MNTPRQWPEDYQHWTGTFEDLVKEAGDILAQVDPTLGSPTSSLVRYYQQQGAVGRGQKKGRSASFGYEDLARVVATKQMASQQVPLSISKSVLANTPVDTITRNAGLAPHAAYTTPAVAASAALSNSIQTGNDAEQTVAKLLAGANYYTPTIGGAMSNAAAPKRMGCFAHTESVPMAPTPQAFSMQAPPLPPGGTLRYTLPGNVVVEIPVDARERQAQAQALRDFAAQLDPSHQPPTWSIP